MSPALSPPAPDTRVMQLTNALMALDRVSAATVITKAVSTDGYLTIADDLITPALDAIGEAWDRGEASLAQVYVAARVCEEMMKAVAPVSAPRVAQPRIGLAVLEDHHELGKRIISGTLHATGRTPIDYGAGITAADLAARAVDDNLDILLVSTLMLRAALQVEHLVKALRAGGSHTLVAVGGAPFRFDSTLWREVGADAMGRTASDALALVVNFAGGRS